MIQHSLKARERGALRSQNRVHSLVDVRVQRHGSTVLRAEEKMPQRGPEDSTSRDGQDTSVHARAALDRAARTQKPLLETI